MIRWSKRTIKRLSTIQWVVGWKMGCIIQSRSGEAEEDKAEENLTNPTNLNEDSQKTTRNKETTHQCTVMCNPQKRKIELHSFHKSKRVDETEEG